ncbi:D-glycero-beta-D-manno-heptose-7-phosphate kinase [Candidatus Omnitrophota bacterium]
MIQLLLAMKELRRIINRFSKARILVIGDLILDEYIWGDVDRISPEAPVPVLWAKKRTFLPGGAANVANNIRSLGAEVLLSGIIGRDDYGRILLSELKKRRTRSEGIFRQSQRPTTLKTRIIAGHQQVVRMDWEHRDALPRELNARIIRYVRKEIVHFDAVIVEDYGKGVVNAQLIKEVIALAKRSKKIVVVDPKEEHFGYYRKATCITPNRRELENAVRNLKIKDTANKFRVSSDALRSDKDINFAARQILKYLNLESLLVTMGEDGMRLFERGGKITKISTVAQEVFDVSGAGDTVVATFSLALACGASKVQAAHIANFAAGIVVSKIGTAVIEKKELLEMVK